tara:strand:+ start:364 stop:1182 length:819 start_codon:yes stop_codon:yes gene_type:complete
MKFHHNKKRNTALIYEMMVSELTKAIINKDDHRKNTVSMLFKKYFSKGTPLSSESTIYSSLAESRDMDTAIFKEVVQNAKVQYRQLDEKSIFNQQTRLISEINKSIGKEFWSNFVKDYQWTATSSQVLKQDNSPKNQVLLEHKLLDMRAEQQQSTSSFPRVNNLAIKSFVQKFNSTYKETLTESQRKILNKFILSSQDNGLELKTCIYEEISTIKEGLQEVHSQAKDAETKKKIEKVIKKTDSYNDAKVDQKIIFEVFQMQSLVGELRKKCL